MKPLKLNGNMLTISIDKETGEAEVGENINLLTESEWRLIHNALAVYQCSKRQASERQQIQLLMNKVRDAYIAPYCLPDGRTS